MVPLGDTDTLLDVSPNPIFRVRIYPHSQPVSRRWEANEKPFPSFSASLPLSSHFDETWPSVTAWTSRVLEGHTQRSQWLRHSKQILRLERVCCLLCHWNSSAQEQSASGDKITLLTRNK